MPRFQYELTPGDGPNTGPAGRARARFQECRDLFAGATQPRISTRAKGDAQTIEGYAAVYFRNEDPEGTQYRIFPDLIERIMPGAFDMAIREGDDARADFNHDGRMLLGRRSNGTCRLELDATGLRYECDPPQTRRDVVELIERGDVDGSSFAFLATTELAKRGRVVWAQERDPGTGGVVDVREVWDLELFGVGPVVRPAYAGATAGTRSQVAASPDDLEVLALERAQFRGALARSQGADEREATEVADRARLVFAQQRALRLGLPAVLPFERPYSS